MTNPKIRLNTMLGLNVMFGIGICPATASQPMHSKSTSMANDHFRPGLVGVV